jgi:hypothetical protein
VHERRLERHVAQRRGAERVPVRRVARGLLEPEVLVRARAVEGHVGRGRRDLRDAGHVRPEVAEHLARRARDRVARHAPGAAEEQHGAPLLGRAHGVALPAREAVERRVGVGLRELELGEGAAHVLERERRARAHVGERAAEPLAVLGHGVEPPQHLGAQRVVVAGDVEAGGLGALRGRDERLRREQVRQVRERGALGRGEREARAVVERVARAGAKRRVPHERG